MSSRVYPTNLWREHLLLATATTGTGNGPVNVGGVSTILFEVFGTFSGTVTFQGATRDGGTFYAIPAVSISTGTISATATAPGLYLVVFGGLTQVQANVTVYATGTITCDVTLGALPSSNPWSPSTSSTGAVFTIPATSSTNTTGATVSVTTGSTTLLAANAARKGMYLINNGATSCYVAFAASSVDGTTATAGGGGLLAAGGVIYDSPTTWQGSVSAICHTGSTVVAAWDW